MICNSLQTRVCTSIQAHQPVIYDHAKITKRDHMNLHNEKQIEESSKKIPAKLKKM